MTWMQRQGAATAVLAWFAVLAGELSLALQRGALVICALSTVVLAVLAARRGKTVRPLTLLTVAGLLLIALLLVTGKAGPERSAPALRLGLSMALLGVTVTQAVLAAGARRKSAADAGGEGFALLCAGTALATSILLLTGAIVTGENAGLACSGWPLCNGEVFPAGDRLAGINAFHRVASAGAGTLVAVLLWRTFAARPRNRALVLTGGALAAVYAAQVVLGAVNVWLDLAEPVRAAGRAGTRVTVTAEQTNSIRSVNVLARPEAGQACSVLVGGHLDTVPGAPGALDNGSGATTGVRPRARPRPRGPPRRGRSPTCPCRASCR